MRSGMIILLVSMVMVAGCASLRYTIKSPGGRMVADTWEDSPITNVFIQTIGIGVADQSLPKIQRRATSREAAIVQAQHEMLSTLKGVKVGDSMRAVISAVYRRG